MCIRDRRRNHPEFQNNSGKTQRPAVRGLDLPDAAYQDGAMTDTVIETLRTLGEEPFFCGRLYETAPAVLGAEEIFRSLRCGEYSSG